MNGGHLLDFDVRGRRRSLLEHLGFEDMLPVAEALEPRAAAESSNADVTAAAARLGEPEP